MSKKIQSWQSFNHHLKGSDFSTPQRSTLYERYKSGDIKNSELDFPDSLGKYLRSTYSVSPKKSWIDYDSLKSRLLKFFDNFKEFSPKAIAYLKAIGYYKQGLEYAKTIQKDPEDQIDYIIEVLEKYEKPTLSHNIDFNSLYYDYIVYLHSLASFGEPKIASKVLQEVAVSNKEAYKELQYLYQYFSELFDGDVGRLRIGNAKGIMMRKLKTGKFQKLLSDFGNTNKIKKDLEDLEKNPDKQVNSLILEYFQMRYKIEDCSEDYTPGPMETSYRNIIITFLRFGAVELIDDFLKSHYTCENKQELYIIYSKFPDLYIGLPDFKSRVTGLLVDLESDPVSDVEYPGDMYQWDIVKNFILAMINPTESHKQMVKENKKLKQKIEDLKSEIVDLRYRPGGIEFKKAMSRQVGRFGIKE